MKAFSKVTKYIMSEETSIDIDTPLDWKIAEFHLQSSK
jgi:CMP-N-acetylneuraminic acid synthetase